MCMCNDMNYADMLSGCVELMLTGRYESKPDHESIWTQVFYDEYFAQFELNPHHAILSIKLNEQTNMSSNQQQIGALVYDRRSGKIEKAGETDAEWNLILEKVIQADKAGVFDKYLTK